MKATAAIFFGVKLRPAHFLLALALLLLTGCLPGKTLLVDRQACTPTSPVEDGARLFLYLNLERPEAPPLRFVIESLELLVDGVWLPVLNESREIEAATIGSGQIFLGRQMLAGSLGQKVRVNISAAWLGEDQKRRALEILDPVQVIELNKPLVLTPGSSQVLLLALDVERSLLGPALGDLALTIAAGREARVTANLAYVSSAEEGTIFVIRLDQRRVVDAFAITGKPSRLAVDQVNKKLVVLAEGEAMVKVVDLSTNYLEKEIKIPLIRRAVDMAVSKNLEDVYVLDNDEVVTRIDLLSGNFVARNRIGNRLNFIHFMNQKERLAVSSSNDKTVYFINAETLQVEDSVAVASAPAGLLEWDNLLYITEPENHDLSIYDLNVRKLIKTVGVGFQPVRVVAGDDNIYVANAQDGSLSVLRGGQFSVIRNITVGKSVREMAVDEKQNLLLAAEDTCAGSVAFIDTTANQVLGRVEVGAKPSALVIVH